MRASTAHTSRSEWLESLWLSRWCAGRGWPATCRGACPPWPAQTWRSRRYSWTTCVAPDSAHHCKDKDAHSPAIGFQPPDFSLIRRECFRLTQFKPLELDPVGANLGQVVMCLLGKPAF